ncbi:MAG: triose-phosphate isomerase [Bauldia sp.]|nr:triose-phosphate isomerase [Bauldia sp.]
MARIKPLVAGNWKMNGGKASLMEIEDLKAAIGSAQGVEVVVCPPATLVSRASIVVGASGIGIGGQDCHAKISGAHTGDIAAEMLADAGATFVIVGHSERRADHHESNEDVRGKAEAAWRAGLVAILCVGELKEQRLAGEALAVVEEQLRGSVPDGATAANLVIAYEPVWAIGTGLVPTGDDIAAMHAHIRGKLAERFAEAGAMRILYGGSVKPDNAAEIFGVPGVNGALVGGASLKASDFLAIVAGVPAETRV